MTTHREGIFVDGLWVDKTPLPDSIPKVSEVGLTSAPLESIGFHFAAYCKPFSEDFMLCKNSTQDPEKCLKEGRRVTRCALDLINKLKANCDEEWKKHWECLDKKNHHLWQCRTQEREFNDCVFKKLGITKTIPDTPEGQTPVHLKENPFIK
ncbi:hypothetical protein HDU78_008825 [Chytriomyces hyalinus]|uniref:NADH-ubiquinone oxidoreductase n=1 Tax=Chytriomyces confervae TaxID=246404 RepID=A0A507FED7_9FUNG|nr:hypothetical protein BJ741DRAFT_599767 [Chytriomyces cf. hyalinus JEL632]KAJ3229785.1 hypothetical protein HDU78_008825 [Chytriomyces hyalinus]KAJ3266978.1 hypothetical protein HDU77_008323 [Chytriomyces hyalinus]KAJ3407670.1 hypothetical protein HDU80_008187 [Chytriomyces hyalinus]TPX74711.1 hypothetical protein CcCBS67573_g04028 [Chytriomyces confervae]